MKGHDKFAGLHEAVAQVMQEGVVKAGNKSEKDVALGTAFERPDMDAGDRTAEKRIQQIRNKNRDNKGMWRANKTGKSHINTSAGPKSGQLPENVESIVDRLIESELFSEEEINNIIESMIK